VVTGELKNKHSVGTVRQHIIHSGVKQMNINWQFDLIWWYTGTHETMHHSHFAFICWQLGHIRQSAQ